MLDLLDGVPPYRKEDAERYQRLRWWPGLTLGDLLDKAADVYPDKEGFSDGRTTLTFQEARDRTNRLALSLMNLGIAPKDRVLVQVPNWNEFVLAYFAVQKIGAVAVLLIDRFRQHEIGHLVELTGAAAWVVAEKYRKTDYFPIVEDIQREHPRLKHVILARGEDRRGCLSMDRLIEESASDPDGIKTLAERRPDPNQVAHMGPTGGTTGMPKVVPRTHNSLICGLEYAALAFELHLHDVCLLAGPIGHDLTFTKGFLPTLFNYGKTAFLDSMDPGDICRTIAREKVTAVVWVPTLARRLIDFDHLGDHDLRSLKKMQCGGGMSQPDLVGAVRERLGCAFFNAYGGTEGQTTMARSNDPFEKVLNSVGRPTCPYDTYKVVDARGKTLPPNTPGELLVKGPGVFTGYYDAPWENGAAFDEEGFFRTGDVARIDEKGYVILTGRIKEMINRGGESISATEIERLISDHPGVSLVAVVPMPDPLLGERVCAYIQPRPGANLTFEKVISYLRERKASVLQLPERIEFVEAMPLTRAEKVDKIRLKEDIERKVRG
jgi:non-ribosomal peptide synthetase component E (peptide arylation enzyme)